MKSEDTENSPSEAILSQRALAPARLPLHTRPEALLAASAIMLTLGLVLAGTVSRGGGGALVIASWAIFVFGLHRYGRSGRG